MAKLIPMTYLVLTLISECMLSPMKSVSTRLSVGSTVLDGDGTPFLISVPYVPERDNLATVCA